MSDAFLTAVFSLGTASSSAAFSLIVRRGQKHGDALTGVLIGLIVNVPVALAATAYFWQPSWGNPVGLLWFALAGLTGPSMGRVFMYQSIHRLGVARAMPMMATGPLFTGFLAVALLGERPGFLVWAGTFLTVAGCAAIGVKKKEDLSWSRRDLWLPLISVGAFAVSNVFRKLGLGVTPSPLFGITVTSATGLALLFILRGLLPAPRRPSLKAGKAWAFYGASGALNTLSFLLHYYALLHGDLTIVTPLSTSSPLFALLFSWLFMRDVERMTGWIVAGTVLIVLGGALVAWRML